MNSANAVINTLNKELEIYKDLLELSIKKKNVIIEGKVHELDNITKIEQNLVFDIGQLEKKREEELARLCLVLGIVNEKITISNLLSKLNSPEKEKMAKLQKDIADVLARLKQENELNGELIKQSLEYIDFSINMLTSAGVNTGSLYEHGREHNMEAGRNKNIFDAKV